MTADLEATVRDLAAREAVRQIFYNYVDRIDAGDLDAAGALFAPDATYDFMGIERQGVDKIIGRIRRALSDFDRTSHHVSNALVEIEGDRARLSASLYAYHSRRESGEAWHFWGRYTQRLTSTGGRWLITHMALIGIDGHPMAADERALFPGRPDRQPIGRESST
jgi:ketosteroid isomerase-like protein